VGGLSSLGVVFMCLRNLGAYTRAMSKQFSFLVAN